MNAEIVIPATPAAANQQDVRPYVIRTYDRWIILALVLTLGWVLFRPLVAFTVYYRGVSYERMLRLNTAEHYYSKSTRVYARIPQGWQAWGDLYLMRAPSDLAARKRAIELFSEGIEHNPSYAPLAFNLGRTYYLDKDYVRARQAFERSAQIAPGHMLSWDFAAWASLRSGDADLARKYWHQVLKIDPGNATAARCLRSIQLCKRQGAS